jgi:hypothetical protein
VVLTGRPGVSGRVVTVEYVRVEVGAVRPDDGSMHRIHPRLAEATRILSERFEHGSPQLTREIDLALCPVVETPAAP